MSEAPEWKFHWYQHAFGFGLVRFATIYSDKAVPSFKLGEDTFELVTGSAEMALKQYVVSLGVGAMSLSGEPVPDREPL